MLDSSGSSSYPALFRFRSATSSRPLKPGRSILTGCTSSTSVARAVVKPAVLTAEENCPEVTSSVHVDDVSQEAQGSKEEVLALLKEAGSKLVQAMTEQGQVMSSKSVVVSSSSWVAHKLSLHFWEQFRVKVSVEASSEHLGILRGNGKCTQFKTLHSRFKRAGVRTARTKWLVKKDRRAAKLFCSGSWPQAVYGSAATGLPLTLQGKLDSLCLSSQGYLGHHPCRTSAIMGKLGFLPSVETLMRTPRAFVKAWKDFGAGYSRGISRIVFFSESLCKTSTLASSVASNLAFTVHMLW